jgi:cation-transporting P-type ATPase E
VQRRSDKTAVGGKEMYLRSVHGVVLRPEGLEVDEALLTGEAEPVARPPGGQVLSGSFVVAGTGRVRAAAVCREVIP